MDFGSNFVVILNQSAEVGISLPESHLIIIDMILQSAAEIITSFSALSTENTANRDLRLSSGDFAILDSKKADIETAYGSPFNISS